MYPTGNSLDSKTKINIRGSMKKSMLVQIFITGIGFGSIFATAYAQPRLVVAWQDMPRTVDPHYAVDADSQYLENLLHCSLVDFDAKGQLLPWLAEKLDWQTPTRLSVTLRKDAKFSDGKPITAEDVKSTFSFFLRKDVTPPSPRAGAFRLLTLVEAKGQEVIFHLLEPDADFAENLVVGILPATVAAKTQMLSLEKPFVGCGPYVLKEHASSHLLLEENSQYTLRPACKMKQVEIKIVKDETTQFAKLLKGEIDLSRGISLDKVKDLKRYPTLKVQQGQGLQTTYLGFNFQDRVLQHAKVRQAIAHAINREAIITHLFHGFAIPASTLLPPSHPFFRANNQSISFNPEEAKKLLDAAGFPQKGTEPRFALTYKTTANLMRLSIAKAIASDLKKVGIDVSVQSLEWGALKGEIDKGNVQMWSLSWIGFKGPGIYQYAFGGENFPPAGANRGRYLNPKLDVLFKEARTVTAFSARKTIYDQVQEIVQADQPYVFLWHEANYMVMRTSIDGFVNYADGRYSSLPLVTKK